MNDNASYNLFLLSILIASLHLIAFSLTQRTSFIIIGMLWFLFSLFALYQDFTLTTFSFKIQQQIRKNEREIENLKYKTVLMALRKINDSLNKTNKKK